MSVDLTFPKTRIRRSVLFSFFDLVGKLISVGQKAEHELKKFQFCSCIRWISSTFSGLQLSHRCRDDIFLRGTDFRSDLDHNWLVFQETKPETCLFSMNFQIFVKLKYLRPKIFRFSK